MASGLAAHSHQDLCISEKTEATSLKALAVNALVTYNQQLADLRTARNAQIALYNSRQTKLANALTAINQALAYVSQLEIEASNLDTSHIGQLLQLTNALMAVSVQTKQTNKVLPVYNKLIQLHNRQHFDVNDVSELGDLLEGIKSNVQDADHDLDVQEAADKATFEQREADLISLIAKLNEQVVLSDAYIGKMDACIAAEQTIIEMADDKVTRNNELKAYAETICQDNEEEWTAGENSRHHQLELLNQLQWALDQLTADYQADLFRGVDNIKEITNPPVL